MALNLNLEIVGKGTRGGATQPFHEAAIENLSLASTSQEAQDRTAFEKSGWRFEAQGAATPKAGSLPRGLLARRLEKPGLFIVRDRIVVGFRPDLDVRPIVAKYRNVRHLPFGQNVYELDFALPDQDLGGAVEDAKANLIKDSGGAVRFVEPVLVYHLQPISPIVPTEIDSTPQWQWDQISLEQAWHERQTKGKNVRVAVIDDGFFEHPVQLRPNVVERMLFDEDGNLVSATLPKRTHGTFCAGLVGAIRDGVLVNGAAPECGLILVALGDTVTTPAMSTALAMSANARADVITCSLGPSGDRWDDLDTLKEAITHVNERGRDGKGTVVVWAVSNNEHEIAPDSLEAFQPLVCVAPSDRQDARIVSAFGTGLDLIAPGDAVPGMYWTGGSTISSRAQTGASFAAPCVAGVAALVLSINPTLVWTDVVDILTKGSCDPDVAPKQWVEQIGWGRLNALRAVQATPPPP